MRRDARYKIVVAALTLTLAMLSFPGGALATRFASGTVTFASTSVSIVAAEELSNGRLGIVIDVIGAGVISCACSLDGTKPTIEQTIDASVDTGKGRASGRIVIDVIDAGITAHFSGSFTGTATRIGGTNEWDLQLVAKLRGIAGAKASFELTGVLDRANALLGPLSGSGIVSQDDIDQI